MRILVLLLLFVSVAGCSTGPVGNANVPQPSKAVDLDKYLGKWYEMARYENRFENGCEKVTAEYARCEENERICVTNTCLLSANKSTDIAEGKAKIVDNSQNAKLKVSFFGPFYFGNYWVLDRADDYSWSIVGEPSGRYLWILTRQQNPSKAKREQLVAKVKALGYDTSLLHFTKQD